MRGRDDRLHVSQLLSHSVTVKMPGGSMPRVSKLVVGALIAVVAEVLVNVIAAAVRVPQQYFLLIPGSLILLVVLAIVLDLDLPDGHLTLSLHKSRASSSSWERSGEAQVVEGKRQRRTDGIGWSLASVSFAFAVMLLVPLGIIAMVGTSKVHRNIPQGSAMLTAGFFLFAVAEWAYVGVRSRLIFSREGICLVELSGKKFIRWDEATNFRTLKPFLITVFLVADSVPGSRWFEERWDYDEKRGVIRLCDLTALSISPGRVNAALEYWDPN
jgi:hypothetical protein